MRHRPATRLLVVDDEPANLAVFEGALAPLGHVVAYAHDAQEARRIAAGAPFDLVLLDVSMPGESGIDLCRSWRQTLRMARTPIVLVTALTAADHRSEGLRAGADDYLEKPVDLDVLADRVASWIGRGRRLAAVPTGDVGRKPAADRFSHVARRLAPHHFDDLALAMARAAGLPEPEAPRGIPGATSPETAR